MLGGIDPRTPTCTEQKWQAQQKPGCGFRGLRVCACFSLKTGAALSFKAGNKKGHELRLFRAQWDSLFQKGDICLADIMFSSYFDLAMLSKRGIDRVVTQAAGSRRPIKEADAAKRLGDNDLLVSWSKPQWYKKATYTREEW